MDYKVGGRKGSRTRKSKLWIERRKGGQTCAEHRPDCRQLRNTFFERTSKGATTISAGRAARKRARAALTKNGKTPWRKTITIGRRVSRVACLAESHGSDSSRRTRRRTQYIGILFLPGGRGKVGKTQFPVVKDNQGEVRRDFPARRPVRK